MEIIIEPIKPKHITKFKIMDVFKFENSYLMITGVRQSPDGYESYDVLNLTGQIWMSDMRFEGKTMQTCNAEIRITPRYKE